MSDITDDELLYLELLMTDRPPETPEEIDAVLRAEGLDPEEVGRKYAEVMAKAIEDAKRMRGDE
jgi:hypothetical protein